MIEYPEIDEVALQIGPVAIHWYGLCYLGAFVFAYWFGMRRARRAGSGWSQKEVSDLIFYGALGVVLGGRLGFVLFYGLDRLFQDPLFPFKIWQGGMSFHGGFLGVTLATWIFARHTGRSWFAVADFVAPITPVGLGLGRIGNFINTELKGRVTEVPWAFVFPGEDLGRHPSSLYQAFLEGVVLFAVVAWFTRKARPEKAAAGAFMIGYAVLRFISEFFRMPDEGIGFIAFDWVTMGQALSLPMLLVGLALMYLAYTHDSAAKPTTQQSSAKAATKSEDSTRPRRRNRKR